MVCCFALTTLNNRLHAKTKKEDDSTSKNNNNKKKIFFHRVNRTGKIHFFSRIRCCAVTLLRCYKSNIPTILLCLVLCLTEVSGNLLHLSCVYYYSWLQPKSREKLVLLNVNFVIFFCAKILAIAFLLPSLAELVRCQFIAIMPSVTCPTVADIFFPHILYGFRCRCIWPLHTAVRVSFAIVWYVPVSRFFKYSGSSRINAVNVYSLTIFLFISFHFIF